MTRPVLAYRWSRSEFVRAAEAGAFDHRAELIDGEIWPVVIGSWRGDTVGRLLAMLPRSGVRVTTATLPTGESLPDPDCWVRRAEADPVGAVGSRLSVWDASDGLSDARRVPSRRTHPRSVPVPGRRYGSCRRRLDRPALRVTLSHSAGDGPTGDLHSI